MLNELMAQAVSSWGAHEGFQSKVNTVVSSNWLPVITQAQGRENDLIRMSKQAPQQRAPRGVGVGSGHSQKPGESQTSFSLLAWCGPRRT